MAYDSNHGEMVLFGGETQEGVQLGDTWTWDGEDWTLETPPNSPSPRSNADMAFDAASGQMLLIGGQPDGGGETWRWNGSTWTELSPSTPAPEVFNPSLAYDPGMEMVLLFGGAATNGDLQNSTWSWNGITWTQLAPQTSPSPRWGAAMAYDPANDEMVLFGGIGENTGFADTWTWNGTTWNQETPAHDPPLSFGLPMAFSPATGSVIKLAGGGSETWGWDGTDWSRVTTFASPPARASYPMALDESKNELVLFGGLTMEGPFLGDTWTFGVQSDQAPVATISSPSDGQTFKVGDEVSVDFSCAAATDGPPLDSCVGSDGRQAPGGMLDTSTAGDRIYVVTATAEDGQTGSASIGYRVVKKASPKPPACRKVRGGLGLGTFGLVPPLGDAPPVPGLRIRIRARRDVDAKITPRITFAARGWASTVSLRPRIIRIDHSRKLRFRIPAGVRKEMRRERGSVYGARVTFSLQASVKAHGDRSSCFRKKVTRTIRTRVVNVSSRVALRRR